MTGVLFLSPVFYSLKRLGPDLQTLVLFNPISFIVVQSRAVLIEGRMPDWAGLLAYLAAAWVVAAFALVFFRRARRNFADVL
jgi:lipopolysaccharide transport system permease protein